MSLITSQMSHQAAVSRKHYACVAGTEDAATVFEALEKLRGVGSSASNSSTEPEVWSIEEGEQLSSCTGGADFSCKGAGGNPGVSELFL